MVQTLVKELNTHVMQTVVKELNTHVMLLEELVEYPRDADCFEGVEYPRDALGGVG